MREIYKNFLITAPLLTRGWKAVAEITVTDTITGKKIILPCSVDITNGTIHEHIYIWGRRHFIYDNHLIVFTGCHLVCWKFADTLESWKEIFQQEFSKFSNADAFVLYKGKIYIAHGERIICFDPIEITITETMIPQINVPIYTLKIPLITLKKYQEKILVDVYYPDDTKEIMRESAVIIGKWLARQILNNPKPMDVLIGRVFKKINQFISKILKKFPFIEMIPLSIVDIHTIFQGDLKTKPNINKFIYDKYLHTIYKKSSFYHSLLVYGGFSLIGELIWYFDEKHIMILLANGDTGGIISPVDIGIADIDGQYLDISQIGPTQMKLIYQVVIESYCKNYMELAMYHIRNMIFDNDLEVYKYYLFDGHTFIETSKPPSEIYRDNYWENLSMAI